MKRQKAESNVSRNEYKGGGQAIFNFIFIQNKVSQMLGIYCANFEEFWIRFKRNLLGRDNVIVMWPQL